MKEAKKYKIKRPKFIIFTDKDGTLDLDDTQLNNIFELIKQMNGAVIPITGRTVGDIQEDLKNKKLKMPEIIVGDNGANIYSPVMKEFLIRKTLEHEKVVKIVDEFVKKGGNADFIRYTDGSKIFASNSEDVREYYKDSTIVKYCDDILQNIEESENINKVTLAGNEELIEGIAQYVEDLEFWTDMDKTKFPRKDCFNFRLDISQKNINKGEAIRGIIEQLRPRYGYMSVGNGNNDIAMFERTIDDDMVVAIMGDSSPELIDRIKKYSTERKKGRVMVIPKDKNLANNYILKMAKIFEMKIKSEEKEGFDDKKKKRLPNLQRIDIKHIPKPNTKCKSPGSKYNKER